MALLDGVRSLMSSKANRVKNVEDETKEGVFNELLPELTLDMTDEELLALKGKWFARFEEFSGKIEARRKANEKYWRGEQFSKLESLDDDRPVVDNLIFQALETFLPIATRQNPEPLVESEAGEQGRMLADNVRRMLSFQADELNLKLKVKRATRFWALYLTGVVKMGWSEKLNDMTVTVLRPQKLIMDPDGIIDDDGSYTGEFLGEYKKATATQLISRFAGEGTDPAVAQKIIKDIQDRVDGKMGTTLQYIEWWTPDYVFWTMDSTVLGKANNPHWNYDEEVPVVDPMTQMPMMQTKKGYNHFATKKIPYCFISVFNLGEHPWDDTSLIEQNMPLQDLVNKRLRQYDKNVDNMNGGMVASGLAFTKEEAELAAKALQSGGIILVPNGDTNAIRREQVPSLPGEVYSSLQDYRVQLTQIFGTGASSAAGLQQEDTVRGKILAKSQDESRIGGGISEYIERFTDNIFNWMVQLMCVYYTDVHYATVLGADRAAQVIQLQASDFQSKLKVAVKEGSLIPKDPVFLANQAMDLWSAGAIAPQDLFERLDDPNPQKTSERLFLWRSNPLALFPDLLQQPSAAPQAPGGVAPAPAVPPQQDPVQAAMTGAQEQASLNRVPLPGQGGLDQGVPRV